MSKRKKPSVATHDYTERYWGHDYTVTKVEEKPYLGFTIHAGREFKVFMLCLDTGMEKLVKGKWLDYVREGPEPEDFSFVPERLR